MALQIVNTAPGSLPDDYVPGEPIHMGLRSETQSIVPGSLQFDISLSNLAFEDALPVGIELVSIENIYPLVGETDVFIDSGEIRFDRVGDSEGERCLYPIWTRIGARPNLLAHFSLRVDPSSWTRFSPSWTDLGDIVAPFMGVEHGVFNTGVFLFLRDDGADGKLVISGPQAATGGARQGQVQVDLAWTGLADGTVLQFWIVIDASSQMVEIWSAAADEPPTTLMGSYPLSSFGEFPTPAPGIRNTREGTSNTGLLYFGNAGRSGDTVFYTDWAFFPDHRKAVIDGSATANHSITLRPDSPHVFQASNNALPTELEPGRWFTGGDIEPVLEKYFAPGNPYTAEAVKISKSPYDGTAYLQREEPRLAQRDSGVVFEAYLKLDVDSSDESLSGAGIAVTDGERSYSAIFDTDGWVSFNTESWETDVGNYVLIRITIDRLRSKVNLHLNGKRVASADLTDFPGQGSANFRVGFVSPTPVSGRLFLEYLLYLVRYFAWEGTKEDDTNGALPDDGSLNAEARFALVEDGLGSSTMSEGALVLEKTEYVSSGSTRYYSKSADFSEIGGVFLEFSAKVESYSDSTGTPGAGISLGAGATIYLGNKKLFLGFFDCGVAGRRVGVIPGTGAVTDILNVTSLGRAFSIGVDWSEEFTYRVEIRGREAIRIWVNGDGDLRNRPPEIEIPWRGDNSGFDLPTDLTTPSITFGHFEGGTSSRVRWRFVRWGVSNGFDASVRQAYPEGLPSYLFGGRAYLVSEFDES